MHDWVDKLRQMQAMDMRAAKLRYQQKKVPQEKEGFQNEREEVATHLAETKKRVDNIEKQIKMLQIDAQTAESKKSELESKSAMIKDNKEYTAAMREISAFDQKIAECDKKQLQLVSDRDFAKVDYERAKKLDDAAQKRIEKLSKELDNLFQACEEAVEKIKVDRKTLKSAIPEQIAQRYTRLRKQRIKGLNPQPAFAPIRENDICGACNMSIPAQSRMNAINGQMVSCAQCGVLLYYDREEL
jgi:predicted  nucleic acid-binding Zn-ribbon protein